MVGVFDEVNDGMGVLVLDADGVVDGVVDGVRDGVGVRVGVVEEEPEGLFDGDGEKAEFLYSKVYEIEPRQADEPRLKHN